MPAYEYVQKKDLPDFRNFLVNPVASPLTITGTAPTIVFEDTTGGDDDYSLSADADIFRLQNTNNNATVLRLVDGAGEDFDLNVDTDILSIINPTGPITYVRFRGGANDDIQIDRPVTFNSTVSGLTFTDITLSDASPTITFTDTTAGHDDYTIAVDVDVMTITNLTSGSNVILGQAGNFFDINTTGSAEQGIIIRMPNATVSTIPAIQVVESEGQTGITIRNSGEVLSRAGYPNNIVDVPLTFIVFGGQYDQNEATVGNVGAGQDTLHSYTILGNVLAQVGDSLDFIGGGTILAAGTTKEVGFFVGGTAVFLSGAFDPSVDAGWSMHITVMRIDSDSVIVISSFTNSVNQNVSGNSIQVNGLTFSGNITMNWTGQDTDGTSNRVTQNMSVVRKFARA